MAAASPLVIFLALPPFYNGIWVQVEGAMPWLHLLSAAAAAAIAGLAARGDAEILATLRHPLFLVPVLTALLSLLLPLLLLLILGGINSRRISLLRAY